MRRVAFVVSVLMLAAGALASGAGAKQLPEVIPLPTGFQPEGIAAGEGSTFYVGSISTGAVFQGDFRTGDGAVLVPGQDGRAAIGVAFDGRRDRVFVAGGDTGKAFVYDADTGDDVGTFQLTTKNTFVNDVVVIKRAAWFTDSVNQVLYRLPIGKNGSLGPPETVPLTGDIAYTAGFNANGIEAARHGKVLVIVQSNVGKLFTVEPKTGATREIDLGGQTVERGDGILLQGRTLYVVQNTFNKIAVVKLDRGLRSGEIVRHLTDTDLAVPTTIDEFAGRLWAVNARFGAPTPQTQHYEVVQVRIGKDAGDEEGDDDDPDEGHERGKSHDDDDDDERDD
jgi:hypothetical protein